MASVTDRSMVIGLCIEDFSSCDMLVSQVALGHVFGHNQRMQLIVQGANMEQVSDLCLEIQDCAYSLVEDISGCVSFLDTHFKPDVLLVILSGHGHCAQWSSLTSLYSLVNYISDLSQSLSHCQLNNTYIIVTGDTAMIAANLLYYKLDANNRPVQLIAVDGDHEPDRFTDTQARPQHLGQIQRISSRVKQWWTGCKGATKTYLGSQFLDLTKSRGTNSGYFFSTPVELDGPHKFHFGGGHGPDPSYVARICAASKLVQQMMDQTHTEPDYAVGAQLAKL